MLPEPLSEGLQGLEARAPLGGMKAHAFQGTVIHGEEDRGLAFADGKSCGQIAASHLLDSAGGDGAVMNSGARVRIISGKGSVKD